MLVVVGEKKTEKERCVALMKQVPGNPSPVRREVIERLPAGFSSTETYSMEGGRGPEVWGQLLFHTAHCFNNANDCQMLTVMPE